MEPRRSGFLPRRVVQVHLLERCNLRCSHCYSSSGPASAVGMPAPELVARLGLLRREGYEEVALSGGEPLMAGDLECLLEAACELGFSISVITNGTVVTKKRAQVLARHGVRVAVSIDGRPQEHDARRGEGTFRRAMNGARRLREAGVTWGIAHCVTGATLPDLPWLADLAASEGARVLQLRPLVAVGRARGLRGALDFDERQRVLAIAHLLRVAHEGVLQVQCDLAPASVLQEDAHLHGVLRRPASCEARYPLSDLVNPLVMDARGSLWPLAYGMARDQRIAGPEEWPRDMGSYVRCRWTRLALLLRRTLEGLDPGDSTDWYAETVSASCRAPVAPRVVRRRSLPTLVRTGAGAPLVTQEER